MINSKDRIKQVVIISEHIELYYYIQKYLKSKYTVTKYEKPLFYEKIKKSYRTAENNIQLWIIESDEAFDESIQMVETIRIMYADSLLLIVSHTRNREEQFREKISAIDAGADEYIGGTQTNEEIAASVKALLRRFSRNGDCAFNIRGKSFQINPQTRKLYMNGNLLPLTRTEFDIVNYLVINRNRAVPYKELYEAVWEKEYLHDDMNIMAHIHRIRKKMGDDTKNPLYIQNVYGIGYIIEGE